MRRQSNLDKNEFRRSQYGILSMFLNQSNAADGILTPALRAAALESIGRTLETPVFDFQNVTLGNTRSITIADSENDSRMVTFTFATVSWGFTIVPSLFKNNEIAMQQDFNTKYIKYLHKVLELLDGAGVTALENAKTQVLGDDLGGEYSLTSNVLRVPLAKQGQVIGDLGILQKGNDYYGQDRIGGNLGLESLIRNNLLEKGMFQDSDKSYQWLDKEFTFSNRVANAADTKATGFHVSGNQLGLLFRLDREALANRTMKDGTKWRNTILAGAGIPVGTYEYQGKGDYSAIAGAASADMTAAYKEFYGWSFDYVFVTPHNSDAANIPSPVIKFEVATS